MPKQTAPSSTKPKRQWARRGGIVFIILLLVGMLIPPLQIGLTGFWNIPWSPMQSQRQFQAWRAGEKETRQPIQWMPLNEIPVPLIHYIWSSEDQGFFEHQGFDIRELEKAVDEWLAGKKNAGRGASTITMQTARSVYLWQGRSYLRKALEAYYTVWMELLLSKPRILELYLNHLELGRGVYGVGAGAEAQFGRPLEKLTRRQMMALAAILPNPREWSAAKPNAIVERKIRRIQRLSSHSRFPENELSEGD